MGRFLKMPRVYDLPLVDWISIGLHSKTLEEAMGKIRENRQLKIEVLSRKNNRRYIEKILKEEIFNQFSDHRRPKLETVLNAIDAGQNDSSKDNSIHINFLRKSFNVDDNGKGMGLDDILKFLIIPFSTEKTGLEEIGRFGVGFFSTFNYCMNEPRRAKISVKTGSGEEGYQLGFYALSKEIKDLRMSLKKYKKIKGTKVLIKEAESQSGIAMKEYLESHLKGIPSYKSKIFSNRLFLNDDSENKWYSAPVDLNVRGKQVTQKVGFRKEKESAIILTSQGVKVKEFTTNFGGGATASFPPAVQVVEGRDEFKIDENYKRSVSAYFRAFEEYIKDNKEQEIEKVVDFIPDLASAFDIKTIKDIPNIENIVKELLPGKKYALTVPQFNEFKCFLGEEIEKTAFKASRQACSYWREIHGSEKAVFNEQFIIKDLIEPKGFLEKIEKDPDFYPNLHLIAREINPKPSYLSTYGLPDFFDPYDLIAFVDGPLKTECPFFIDKEVLYINMNHKDVLGSLNLRKVYSNFSEYTMLYELSDKKIKRNIEEPEKIVQGFAGVFYRETPIPEKNYKPKGEPAK
jgi:hypothetical protein